MVCEWCGMDSGHAVNCDDLRKSKEWGGGREEYPRMWACGHPASRSSVERGLWTKDSACSVQCHEMMEKAKQMNSTDAINHPAHYGGDTTYEAIKVIRAWGLGFSLGNTVKYICRAGRKTGEPTIKDLEKAAWYLQEEIKHRKEQSNASS